MDSVLTQEEFDRLRQIGHKPTDPPLSRAEYVRHFERLLESAEGWTDDGYHLAHKSGPVLWVANGRGALQLTRGIAKLPPFGFWGRRKLWPKVEAVRRAVARRINGGAP